MLIPLLAAAVLLGVLAGVLLGVFVAGRFGTTDPEPTPETEPIDEYTAAAIDQAAVNYATAHGRPEAAPLLADKLHLLHRLGRRYSQ